jgi:hypothetical protein
VAEKWNIQACDRGILEAAIGGAVLDKLRNHNTTMADLYLLRGGQDPKSLKVLKDYDEKLKVADYSKSRAHTVLANQHGNDFGRVFSSWNLSGRELALLERAIGASRIARAEGKAVSTLDHYKALGGDNPQTLDALDKLSAA